MMRRLALVIGVVGAWMMAANAAAQDTGWERADGLIDAAIERGEIPGAVLLVGTTDRTLYRKAYGHRALEPRREPMTVDTVFDLASLTKPIATATSIMQLADRGELDLDDAVVEHLPSFAPEGKDRITIEQLLLHRGGLIPDNPLADYEDGPEEAVRRIDALETIHRPGTAFAYTDVGYIVLARIVEAVSGQPLDEYTREHLFEPLGMGDTAFTPGPELAERAAPTEQREGRWMRGEVHDPRAYRLGGVAGHAGLFSTADDLAAYCRMILAGGAAPGDGGERVLSADAVDTMTRPRWIWNGTGGRAYGFDVDTRYASPLGERFPRGRSFGHTGFTGTSMWIVPEHDLFVILLTNRVHPDGSGKVVALRRAVSTAVADAVLGPPEVYGIATGIDMLVKEDFKALAGRKVALITNHTGIDRLGRRTLDLLHAAPAVELVKVFSPEHGLYGVLDEAVGHGTDEATGLPVYSLYGETRRPTEAMLEGIDTIVFDIQDIGARFYTYISTLGNAMEEAAGRGIRVVVLDRPNPITGLRVAGPVADERHFGFTAFGPLPVMHGMTVGELAMLFNAEYGIGCDLQVITMPAWERAMWWDDTGLLWVNPSPNMRNLTQALLYPGVALIEASNVSVGRGTDQPFEMFGAPWINGPELAAALNRHKLPGLRFIPIRFTPESSKFAERPCGGVYITVTDREAIEPVRTGITIAWQLAATYGRAFELEKVVRLLQDDAAQAALGTADDPAEIPARWAEELRAFERTRAKYLIYE